MLCAAQKYGPGLLMTSTADGGPGTRAYAVCSSKVCMGRVWVSVGVALTQKHAWARGVWALIPRSMHRPSMGVADAQKYAQAGDRPQPMHAFWISATPTLGPYMLLGLSAHTTLACACFLVWPTPTVGPCMLLGYECPHMRSAPGALISPSCFGADAAMPVGVGHTRGARAQNGVLRAPRPNMVAQA